jgi:hypothetical protein
VNRSSGADWLTPPLFFRALREKIRNCVTVKSRRLCGMRRHGPATEDAMLRIRIAAAGAVLVIAIGGAAAQTATASPPGKPLPLLRIVQQPNKAKARGHAKMAARFVKRTSAKTRIVKRTSAKTHSRTYRGLAARRSRHLPTQSATAGAAASIWPAAETATPAAVAALAPAPQPAPAFAEPEPSELVVRGETVQMASPDDVNALDLAADDQDAAAANAAKTATPSDVAKPPPAAQAMVATPATPVAPDASPIGSASWITQVLAALGGAVAAGSVAWLLIGSAPQRTYG